MKYTPMMQQYLQVKQNYPDAILFFRLGDFYEMFFDDAQKASRELELTLTARDGGGEKVPMCGVPYHTAETYIARLVNKNYKVVLCDQVESPEEAKGIVRREVTRVVTPGTIMEGQFLDEKSHNYVAAVATFENARGLACADVTTGHFMATRFTGPGAGDYLIDELARLGPKEVLYSGDPNFLKTSSANFMLTPVDPGFYDFSRAKELIENHYGTELENSSLQDFPEATCAAGALLAYLYETQKQKLEQLEEIQLYFPGEFMVLDAATRRNLEITSSIQDGARRGTLLFVLDYTCTAMGGRMLKSWLQQPLLDIAAIENRQDAVEKMAGDIFLKDTLRDALDPVYDLERLCSKVAGGTANARDLISLKQSLAAVPRLKSVLKDTGSTLLEFYAESLDGLEDIRELLENSITGEPPVSVREGGIIKTGYSEEVDRLRSSSTDGKSWIAGLEAQEKERTGIKSLKVGFNKVFGYYIEVTKANLNLVPHDYIRKQTLVNAERFITPRLKEYENLILGAEDRLIQLEYQLFCEIRNHVLNEVSRLQHTADCIARVDALQSLAEAAERHNYTRPLLSSSKELIIKEGRHPSVETMLEAGEFVPNDTYTGENEFLSIITGPNMAGKSTYMRQVALVVLMAQVGCFVPAEYARIGIVDRIFTRVGAADDLAGGRSTFMVEMDECRTILEHATARSLIIMDEVGRGTSTYDGISLARAMVEYIHENIRARTLFSTHYHELTDLEYLPGVTNYTIAVQEKGDEIVFIRKLEPGKADRSYGIQVARLAGIPEAVLQRARTILSALEQNQTKNVPEIFNTENLQEYNKSYLINNYEYHPVLLQLKELDVTNMTPLQALNTIAQLQEKLLAPEKEQ